MGLDQVRLGGGHPSAPPSPTRPIHFPPGSGSVCAGPADPCAFSISRMTVGLMPLPAPSNGGRRVGDSNPVSPLHSLRWGICAGVRWGWHPHPQAAACAHYPRPFSRRDAPPPPQVPRSSDTGGPGDSPPTKAHGYCQPSQPRPRPPTEARRACPNAALQSAFHPQTPLRMAAVRPLTCIAHDHCSLNLSFLLYLSNPPPPSPAPQPPRPCPPTPPPLPPMHTASHPHTARGHASIIPNGLREIGSSNLRNDSTCDAPSPATNTDTTHTCVPAPGRASVPVYIRPKAMCRPRLSGRRCE